MQIVAFFLLFVFLSIYSQQTVFNKNLVASKVNYQDIIDNAKSPNRDQAHIKTFKGGPTLAYVTPWNGRGYDVVKEFKGKFDFVSPVWYVIKQGSHGLELHGSHDVDQKWMKEVRGVMDERTFGKIVPRFQIDQTWKTDHIEGIMRDVMKAKEVVDLIQSEVEKQGFDGIVLESGFPQYLKSLSSLLADELHKHDTIFIMVISPSKSESNIISDMPFVDYWSLMTYDYASYAGSMSPNAPINWVEDQIINYGSSRKLLLGLNMYGMDFIKSMGRGEPILGSKVLSLLEEHKPIIHLDEDAEEHYFEYVENGNQRRVYYPSLKSIEERIRLANDYDVGLSLWEVGQGLDYFYELF